MKVKDFFVKMGRWFVITVLQGLAVMIIKDLAAQCDGNRVEQSAPVAAEESVSSDFAWADSVSAITGIAYGPYFYDPSWPIEYSAAGDTLYYYPRDSVATHFTIPESVHIIDSRAFQCNKQLVEIALPSGVREIGVCSFFGCEKLKKITIEGSVISIPWRAFEGCHELQIVDLPASIGFIGGFSFSGCESLRTFIVSNPKPPHFEFEDDPDDFESMWAFFSTDLSHCTLYVPKGSVEAYRQEPGWSSFTRIESI